MAAIGASEFGCSRGYQPGLGELMSLQQLRHDKLWRAGRAFNWPLAAYEIDEAFGALTNACHQASNFGFNVVRRPSDESWFGNQDFGTAN